MRSDIKLTWRSNGKGTQFFGLGLPAELSRALHERGYNRARISIVEDGILLTPYAAPDNGHLVVEDLPEWSIKETT